MIWLKRIGILIVVIAVGFALYWALKPRPSSVDVAVVERGPMAVTILQDGRTEVRETYEISAPIAGHLARTMLERGDKVEAGKTVIAAIHPLDPPFIDSRTTAELLAAKQAAAAALAIARVDLARHRTNLDLANRALERATRLASTGVIAETALEKANAEVDLQKAIVSAAEATIRLRQAELASAEARMAQPGAVPSTRVTNCCVNITAPITGEVLDVFARSEQAVQPGTRIAEVGDPRDLQVVVDLLSSDAVRIAPGTSARIIDWGGDRELDAVVTRIEPVAHTKVSALGIEEQRVNAVLSLKSGDARLGHNFRVTAEIVIWQQPDVLAVPIASLFRIGNDWAVFRLVDGRLKESRVTIGQMNDNHAEVLDGLAKGDTVVLHPGDTLEDGGLAEPRKS